MLNNNHNIRTLHRTVALACHRIQSSHSVTLRVIPIHSIMKIISATLCLLLLLLTANSLAEQLTKEEEEEIESVTRSKFPDGFLFGASTSAYQIEGGVLEDGKSLNNWDVFCQIGGKIQNDDTGDVAADHYHRYMEDIEILHSLGVNAYRFSISWSRILPRGKFGEVNQAGIMFYNKIIDNLSLRGIQPFVTIHHHDYPEELEDRYRGWLSPLMQEDFVYFAEVCFKNFGDRVKYWSTINEPNLYSEMAYERGWYPPARCSQPFGNCSFGNSDVEPLIAGHNMLLGHAKAVKLYRQKFKSEQCGVIGIVVHAFMYRPLRDDKRDLDAANRALAFNVAWMLDPLVFGDYPPEMRHYHGSELPRFTTEEKMLIKETVDFIGINHYSTLYASDCIYSNCVCSETSCSHGGDHAIQGFVYTTGERDGVSIGPPMGTFRFYVVPRGMEEIVDYVKKRYNNMPIYVTENGYSYPTEQPNELLNDDERIKFHKAYLTFLARAIRNGADVRGYFMWTFLDDFEWLDGYETRYGLYYVDRSTLDRSPKNSAKWYRDFLSNNNLNSTALPDKISFSE